MKVFTGLLNIRLMKISVMITINQPQIDQT
jgi:hypothetical protein